MDAVRDFIVEYIQREYTIPDDVDIMNLNYMEEGYVDSLGLIQFVTMIEDEFGITFSDDDLASPDIKVVGKMAELVISKMEEKSK